jgi:hypothetical protein
MCFGTQIRSGQAGHVFVGLLVSMTHKASVPTWPPLARACWPCVNRCVFPFFCGLCCGGYTIQFN